MYLRVSKKTTLKLNGENDVLHEGQEFREEADHTGNTWLRRAWLMVFYKLVDIHLQINEQFEGIDWDSKTRSVAEPLGNCLTGIFYITRLLQDNLISPNYVKIYKGENIFDLTKSKKLKEFEYLAKHTQFDGDFNRYSDSWYFVTLKYLNATLKMTEVFIILINFSITLRMLWYSNKRYILPYSRNLERKHQLEKHPINELTKSTYQSLSWKTLLVKFVDYLVKKDKTGKVTTENNQHYFTLKRWCPSKFTITLFCAFSPICILFLLSTSTSFYTFPAVVAHQYIMHNLLVNHYERRLTDDSILFSATLNEYDKKVLHRHEIQSGDTLDINGVNKKPTIFKTHALNGDTILEVFDKRKKEFVQITGPSDIRRITPTHSQKLEN